MTLLAGEDYSRYFELLPNMQGLEFPQGISIINLETQTKVLRILKNEFSELHSDNDKADFSQRVQFLNDLVLALETLSNQPQKHEKGNLSYLRLRPITMSLELVTIRAIYQLSKSVFECRAIYQEISKNERCTGNFDSIFCFDRARFKSSESLAFAYRYSTLRDEMPIEEIRLATKHPDEDVSLFAKLILSEIKRNQIVSKMQPLIQAVTEILPFNLYAIEDDFEVVAEASSLQAQILISQCKDHISTYQGIVDGTLKLSFKLTLPSDDELKERIENIKTWSATIPDKIREYEALWKALEGKRKNLSLQGKIQFLKENMSLDSHPLWESLEPLQQCYGLGAYKAAAEKFLSDISNKTESSKNHPSELQEEEKAKGNQRNQPKKSQGKRGRGAKNCKKPATNTPKSTPPKDIHKSNGEISSSPSLPETSAMVANPFAQLSAPPLEHYSERVLTWIEDEIPFHLNNDSYSHLSSEKQAEQHRRHGFSLEVDKFLESKDYAKSTTWQNPTTGHQDRRVFIAGEMEHRGEKQRGFFTFCYGHDGKIYHRHFTTVSTEELIESSLKATYFYDFPSLAEAADFLNDAPPRTLSRQREQVEAIPGAFGSAVIQDSFHNAKITLFKRPEQ